jgi:phage tail-like protein
MSASSEVDKPRPVRRVVLPDVVGVHLDDARIMLVSAGFEQIRVHYIEDYADEFQVVDMVPGSGILVDRSAEVLLRVSRANLVRYLPTAFQQVAQAPDSWLRGFLYIIQQLFDRVQGRVDDAHRLFDPRTADPEFLPWLASWLAISLDSAWDELKTRQMLMAATSLFPYRGTSRSISEFVQIYTDASVKIEENTWPFKGFRIGVHSTVGVDTVILPQMNLAHCFVVRLDRSAERVPEDEIIRIHEIIQSQKPAHCSYFLAFSDEAESGEMGAFLEVGAGIGIGIGVAVGVGVGAGGILIDAPEPVRSESSEAAPDSAEADAPAVDEEADRRSSRRSRTSIAEESDESAEAPEADEADSPGTSVSRSKSKSRSRSKKKKKSDE